MRESGSLAVCLEKSLISATAKLFELNDMAAMLFVLKLVKYSITSKLFKRKGSNS